MTDVILKENLNVTKSVLLEVGRRLITIRDSVEESNKLLEEFQLEKGCIFDIDKGNTLEVDMKDLRNAIKLVQTKIGELELSDTVKRK